MILLDTHIWYWWVSESSRWNPRYQELIDEHADEGLGLSVISCWEVAKKNQIGKLDLDRAVEEWIELAIQYPAVQLLSLSSEIAIESTRLPDKFRSDPADEIIVATARILDCPLLTADDKLLRYAHVRTLT